MSDRQAVRDALQAGYGDATQTVLDDKVAGDVMQALRECGWCSLDEVAALLIAAGGEVVIQPEHHRKALSGYLHVEVSEDFASGGKRVRVVKQEALA